MSRPHTSFSIHLTHQPFEAKVIALDGACALSVGAAGAMLTNLSMFFPLDKLDQVQRIADELNEIGRPADASEPASAPIAA